MRGYNPVALVAYLIVLIGFILLGFTAPPRYVKPLLYIALGLLAATLVIRIIIGR